MCQCPMLTEYHFLSFEHWLGIVCGRCIKIDFSVVWKRVQILYIYVGVNSWSFDNSVLLQCRWSGPTGVLITLALSFYQVCLRNFPHKSYSLFFHSAHATTHCSHLQVCKLFALAFSKLVLLGLWFSGWGSWKHVFVLFEVVTKFCYVVWSRHWHTTVQHSIFRCTWEVQLGLP